MILSLLTGWLRKVQVQHCNLAILMAITLTMKTTILTAAETIEVTAEKQSKKDGDFSMFNYLHLGVLYMEKGDYRTALKHLNTQSQNNNLAENQYYSGLCYKAQNDIDEAKKHLKNAQELYRIGSRMLDPYSELFDQIYLSDIDKARKTLEDL